MKIKLFSVVVACLSVLNGISQTDTIPERDTIKTRIVLIGDAGALVHNGSPADVYSGLGTAPVVQAVRNNIRLDKNTLIIYLGDNLYKTGLPDDQTLGYLQAKSVLDSQIYINAGTEARVVFVPGNHDWNNGKRHGYEAILREQEYIDRLSNASVQLYPREGCPGPVEIKVSDDVTLVVVDTQWWLHESDKPGVESDCPHKTEDEVLVQLEDILQKNENKLVIFACHHPFRSYGIHGGHFTWKQHIFPFTDLKPNLYIPLPIIGSIYPITRGIFGTVQDLPHPRYRNMVNAISKVLKAHPNVIHVSGHEHTLQLIQDSGRHFIVSGSGCKKTRVNNGRNALYTEMALGFATLDVSENRQVDVNFYTVNGVTAEAVKSYSRPLLNFTVPEDPEQDTVRQATVVSVEPFADSVTAIPNAHFGEAGGLKRFFLGKNYRDIWTTPVKLKVFDISKEKGGFKIKSLGGGKQTKSLTITDAQGRDWALRTINKDPVKAIPENFHNSFAEALAQDFISGSYPYAPLLVPPLAKSLDIVVPEPELFFVPDDPAFGPYRRVFANQIVTLEKKDASVDDTDTKSSFTVFEKLLEDNDHRVDQKAALRARLLDILIADWDRHLDQWKFGVADTGKGKLYYPIPKDRDQAFYHSDGFLIRLVSMSFLPFFKGFREDIPKVAWLNWAARDFDRLFLNQLDWNDWQEALQEIDSTLTDEVLQESISRLPREVQPLSGPEFIRKLKARKANLPKRAWDYYEFISEQVNVLGSNKKELFKVTGADRGIRVQVYKRNKESDSASLMYDRVFDPKVTDEVHLYGFNNEDVFDVDESVNSKVRLRIIGGRGRDSFNIRGNLKNFIYDVTYDSNYVQGTRRSRVFIDEDPMRNHFEMKGFEYNLNKFPSINLGFNVEDLLMVGLGFTRRAHGFRKDPYASYQRLSTLYAVHRGAYRVRYQGEFNEVIKKNDIVIDLQLVEPVLNNFFGLGNETKFIEDRDFYRVRYKFASADVMFRKRYNNLLHLSLGPSLFHYWNRYEDNKTRILDQPGLVGLDSTDIYTVKTYLGGKAGFLIDFIDNHFLPTRGIYWNTELHSYAGVNGGATPLTRVITDMTVYGSLSIPAKVVAVMKVGGGHIFNRDFEYFQALNLGQNNFLRGFRKNRFSGRSLAYGSLEMRIKLFGSRSYLFPGDIGLIGFGEAGRVWMPNEHSKTWHTSYGAGLYYTPFNLVIISATAAFSKEETLFNFSVGTRINLTF